MDDAPVLIPFISFLNSVLLRDEICCKFTLKYGIQKYLGKFTKTSSKKCNFQGNKTHTDLVM